jgi:hypothetical protein
VARFTPIAPSPRPQERRFRRFSLRYPVHVTFHAANCVAEFDAVSNNVSIGGLLLETACHIPPHSLVSFVMTVQGGPVVRPIQLTGDGEVVRVEPRKSAAGFAVAVECKRPVTQVKNCHPAPAR